MAGSLVVIGGVIAGIVLGSPALKADASQRLQQGEILIQISWPTYEGSDEVWMPDPYREKVLDTAYKAVSSDQDPLTSSRLRAIAKALKDTNWFSGGPVVEQREGGVIHVRGAWRKPGAVLRIGNRDHLISASGYLLPHEWPAGEVDTPVITGVVYDPAAWPTPDVNAGLNLLRVLERQPYFSQVRGVEVKGFDRQGPGLLTIITDTGSRVVWGAPPGVSAPERSEVSDAGKLRNLASVHALKGRIDAGQRELVIYTDGILVDSRPER